MKLLKNILSKLIGFVKSIFSTRKLFFADIDFKPHKIGGESVQGRLDLGNGLELSVVQGENLYGNKKDNTFEIALFKDNDFVPLSPYDDVLGWQSPDEINDILFKVQDDPEKFVESKKQIKLKEMEKLLGD